MTEVKTVKEQLVEVKAELAKQTEELNYWTASAEREEQLAFRYAQEIAEETKLSRLFDKADSIKGCKSHIKHCEKEVRKINKEIAKLEKEIAKLEKLDVDFDIDVVGQFLAKWRADVETFIREAVSTKYPEAVAKLEASERYQSAKWNERQDMLSYINNQFGSLFMYVWGWRGADMEEKMAQILAQDVEMKKATLLGRIAEITGKVTEAELFVADDGNINGFVTGEKGKAKVQTILAGGYNIQCLHYRLLVNKL
jgi:DNA repair exonuclease SbcCD ATPase subunit